VRGRKYGERAGRCRRDHQCCEPQCCSPVAVRVQRPIACPSCRNQSRPSRAAAFQERNLPRAAQFPRSIGTRCAFMIVSESGRLRTAFRSIADSNPVIADSGSRRRLQGFTADRSCQVCHASPPFLAACAGSLP
jgi:hypothetical protein